MTTEEIIEGNKLIAEFMGFTYRENGDFWIKNDCVYPIMYYQKCWNGLMGVVEKIGSMSFNENQNKFSPSVERFLEVDINSIWKQVVDFIKWYNTQNPTT